MTPAARERLGGLLRCEMVAAAQAVSEYRAGDRGHPRLQQADPAPADRDRWPAMHLDHLVVAGTLVADDALDIDDMAAMNPDEPVVVEPRFDVADGERAKQLVVAVEDVGVVRIGMDRDDVVHGDEMSGAVPFERQVAREAPRRRTDAAERRESAAPQLWAGVADLVGCQDRLRRLFRRVRCRGPHRNVT